MMNKIEVIGLGAGDINQLPLGIYKKLIGTENRIFIRTMSHPVVQALQEEGVLFESFDKEYENEMQFSTVYESIVGRLVEAAKEKQVIYAVPGHPMLAEKTVQLLLKRKDVSVYIAGGQSYLDALFTALRIDPIDGFQFVDGTFFERSQLDYRQPIVFCQVYDRFIASEVKLALLEDLPPDYQVTIVEAAGTESEKLTTLPLEELDRSLEVSNLVSVYVPPAPDSMLNHTFARLKEIIATLRSPEGCPWDRKQTHESLREYAIEEVYELIDAIDEQDDEGIVEELGDVLLQVMLHSQIGEDDGYFTIYDVIKAISDKMIHRHPHVFADTTADTVDQVYKNWDLLKQEEKGEQRKLILDGVPKSLSSLARAYKLQKKAAKVGFDWTDVNDIWAKLNEEIQEVNEAIQVENRDEIEKELGDILFVLANLSRYYKINPEVALNRTNQKFIYRFSYMEQQLREQGEAIDQATLEEMDYYWEQAKRRE
ncbi:tetrapyrrole methylase family protein/MazG family protein [Virgibacillus campisalis]|uniref:Tetrapyrrole methylase family protein/MazG family protein n=2 Tax=Virgibacillus alimentarius TaxID=698769 RepID=A0ABS4S804_9BACI|nr:tetrapyrrole methylase family protein/MazG family protein [Virgibacillus alimentarius]